jgi:hypothetical protein
MKNAPGANYAITIDGVTRTNHDVRETAIEIGKHLKETNRNSDVKVRRIDDNSVVADIIVDNRGEAG